MLMANCTDKNNDLPPVVNPDIVQPVIFCFGSVNDSLTGEYLRPALDSLHLLFPEIVVMNAYLNSEPGMNDSLSNPDSQELASLYQVYLNHDSINSVPYAYFNCEGFIGGLKHESIQFNSLDTSIKWARATKTAGITYDISPLLNGNQLNIDVNFHTLMDYYDAMYFSVVLTEDSVVFPQVNDHGLEKNVHHDVLRKSITNLKGDIIQSSVAKDVEATFTYSTTLDPVWNKQNIKVNVIFWYNDGPYGRFIQLGKRVKLTD